MYLAHICTEKSEMRQQSATEHCKNTGQYASDCLHTVGLGQAGTLMGLVHDCGKFKNEFQSYLMNPRGVRGSVNHTFAGVRLLLERYHGAEDSMVRLSAELLAFAVGSHHGLFDCVNENRQSGFLHRMGKGNVGYSESVRNFFECCCSEDELDQLFSKATEELAKVYERLAGEDYSEFQFQLGLLARLLLSALIEGDRRDTAEFMTGIYKKTEPEDWKSFWTTYCRRVEERLARFLPDTAINRARREISDRCRSMADAEGGIYRLNVPTGGGKTLSSLRYALAHAEKWGKRRVIFTAPLLSILEQNASVIREYVGDDAIILEHHSDILCTEDSGELDHRELAVENWDSPIVITTLVQLLNTLFDGRTTSIRRFQSLCNSVIVIDEVQTVPPRMLSLFNQAIAFLAKICGVTFVLCSATQPCLETTNHPLRGTVRDMIPYDEQLWMPFRRTTIVDAGGKSMEEILDFAKESLEQVDSLLVVCNRKDEAEYLFSRLRDGAEVAYHLSASMCTAHRRNVLERLKGALDAQRKCLCVATQVIEAGVDISFHRVIRLAAGMDSVIQSAGRCNRNGESVKPVPVFVVPCIGENLGKLREIDAAKNATMSLLDAYHRNPKQFGNDLSSDEAIEAYYRKLYSDMKIGYQDYSIQNPTATLFDLLSENRRFYDEDTPCAGMFMLNQAFKLAGSRFEVFDSRTRDLIVPYGAGASLIAELAAQESPSPSFLISWTRRVRPYSIAVYEWQLKRLGNAVAEYAGAVVLSEGFYDQDTGLIFRAGETEFLEV